jgi:predicted nucleotidyltransferase
VDFAEPLQTLIPGATGRIMAALTGTSVPLSGRAVADLAGVSASQAARVLPNLVELGIVEARSAPPATLYILSEDHIATRHLRALRELDDVFLERLRRQVAELRPAPVSVAVFGSLARREARSDSDIDLLVIRPDAIDEENDLWRETVEAVAIYARQLSGNAVDILEVGRQEAHDRLASRRELWRNIRNEARMVHGVPLDSV